MIATAYSKRPIQVKVKSSKAATVAKALRKKGQIVFMPPVLKGGGYVYLTIDDESKYRKK